jgi:peroxiredoxin
VTRSRGTTGVHATGNGPFSYSDRRAALPAAGTRRELLPAGVRAPDFALRDTPHSRIALRDVRGQAVVLAFHVADWHPVATDQLLALAQVCGELERLNAVVLAVSVDAVWSHNAYAQSANLPFPLLADDEPPGAVAAAYGVLDPTSGRSRRSLFVIDGSGIVRWSAAFPDAVNPGVDGVLSALEQAGS